MTSTGLRSSTPAGLPAAENLSGLHEHFWKHGTLRMDHAARSWATFANPLFASPDAALKLHYGLDPLLGFHLATAYLPLAPDHPLHRGNWRKPKLEDVVAAAQAEFSTWCDTFRERAHECMTLRVFAGDALAFCHTLQHRSATGSARTAFWYRKRHTTMDPLVLAEDEYGTGGTAPVSFNVIDNSNLIDHLGGLNLLAATSPLLDWNVSSSLYTETLVQKETPSHREHLNALVGGHLVTASLLLGLFPTEYWTATSPSSIGDEQLIPAAMSHKAELAYKSQLFTRITWKRPPSSSGPRMVPIHIDELELASLLYRIYVDMFPSENVARMLGNLNLGSLQYVSLPSYTRPGFVALLCLVKSRVVTNWDRAMDSLLSRIESDTNLLMGTNYIQELYLYMHLLGVHSVATFKDFEGFRLRMGIERKQAPGLTGWPNLPPSVCVTLKVPRSALRTFFGSDPDTVGTIPVQATVCGSSGGFLSWQNVFAGVQLGFGELSTTGARFTNAFALSIREDALSWHGKSPLYVSFRVPSWTLLLEPRTAIVSFGVQSTPVTAHKFGDRLGAEMNLFKTTLGDSDHVYASKNFPNQSRTVVVPGFAEDALALNEQPNPEVKRVITVHINPQTARVASLTARLDLVSDSLCSSLRNGSPVQTTTVSPCTIAVSIGNTTISAAFPAPILTTSLKTRIARTSSYIELTASILPDPATHPSPTLTCPLIFPSTSTTTPNTTTSNTNTPICWTTPYLSLPTLPLLTTTPHPNPNLDPQQALSFLTTHTSQMFSARERRMRSNPAVLRAAIPAAQARFALKESLFELFAQAAGL